LPVPDLLPQAETIDKRPRRIPILLG